MAMQTAAAIIVGAGQAGLAMSRELSLRSIDHLILERGSPGESWRSRRWNSLRLLTPNWANRLPGEAARYGDPDGYSSASEFANRLDAYSREISAPIRGNTTVKSVTASGAGFLVETDQTQYACQALVIASGAAARASVPAFASEFPPRIIQVSASDYRSPDQLPEGCSLVVGASASGVQLAREVCASGRQTILSVGAHTRLPRTYLDRDIEFWLDATGALDETIADVDDIHRARRTPSPQLTGSPYSVDLNALQSQGVEIVGRLMDVRDGKALFSGGLANVCAAADLKMNRFLDRSDEVATQREDIRRPKSSDRPEPTKVPAAPRLDLDLQDNGIASLIWATGLVPDLSWLHLPVFDRRRRLIHDGGVFAYPGVFAMGLTFMRRRRSHQISGIGKDAQEIAEHIASRLDKQVRSQRTTYAGARFS